MVSMTARWGNLSCLTQKKGSNLLKLLQLQRWLQLGCSYWISASRLLGLRFLTDRDPGCRSRRGRGSSGGRVPGWLDVVRWEEMGE